MPHQHQASLTTWLIRAALTGTGTILLAGVAPHLPMAPRPAYLLGCLWVVAAVIYVALAAPSHGRGALAAVALAALGLLAQATLQGEGTWVAAGVTVGLLLFGTGIGAGVGARIGHPGHLLFVAWVAGLVDVMSLLHPAGISHAVAASPATLSWVAIPFPLFGTYEIVPLLGGGDIVFVALYLAASRAHRLPMQRSVLALVLGFVAAFALVVCTGRAVPVLPFIGATVVALQPRTWRPPLEERRAAMLFAAGLTIVAIAIFVRA